MRHLTSIHRLLCVAVGISVVSNLSSAQQSQSGIVRVGNAFDRAQQLVWSGEPSEPAYRAAVDAARHLANSTASGASRTEALGMLAGTLAAAGQIKEAERIAADAAHLSTKYVNEAV